MNDTYKIALEELRSNYGEFGIYANPFKHRQYWARDSFIASYGACSVGDFDHVKKNLNTFIEFQRSDGHIPARIEENYHILTVLGIYLKRPNLKSLHKQSQPWAGDVVDSNSWFIISAINYVKASGDVNWFRKNKEPLRLAADWLISKLGNNGLIKEGFTANWSDCNLVSGNTIYNNVLLWKALNDLEYFDLADELKKNINKYLWDVDKNYFIHYIGPYGGLNKEFYSDGNLLAIWWGLADKEQSEKILKYIIDNKLSTKFIPIGYPRLVWWDSIINFLIFPMYKTNYSFLLWSCVYTLLLDKTNSISEIAKISDIIAKYGTCHEVVTNEGKPVDILFYNSQKGMAWTSGMYIYAVNRLNNA